MKTNGIGGTTTNRPKWAIYKKLCDVLINLGVQPANIHPLRRLRQCGDLLRHPRQSD